MDVYNLTLEGLVIWSNPEKPGLDACYPHADPVKESRRT